MRKNICFFNACLRMLLLAAGTVLLVAGMTACKEEKAPDVPKEQSDLLFETFRDLEQKKYESALPKLKRYRDIDSTNIMIERMINQTITNIYVVQLRNLLAQGKFAEAESLMDSMLKQHDSLDDRIQLRDDAARLNRIDQLIRKLAPVQDAKSLSNNAENLLREVGGEDGRKDSKPKTVLPEFQKILAYAQRKIRAAEELAKIEKDRIRVWPWLDALDAKNSPDKERAELLRIYVAAQYLDGFGDPVVRELAPENGYSVSK